MKIFFLSDYYEAGVFFIRLANSLPIRKKDVTHITSLKSIHQLAERNGISSIIISKNGHGDARDVSIDHDQVRESICGYMSDRQVRSYAAHWCLTLDENIASIPKSEIIYLCTWNGENVIGNVIRSYKSDLENVRTLFFEITNIPGKIFYCEEGVNARSRLFNDRSILPKLNGESMELFEKWLKDFRKSKDASYQPPQARISKKISTRHFVDFFYAHCFCGQRYRVKYLVKKLKAKMLRKKIPSFLFSDSLPSSYIFFPMQVSDDSQILINSDVDNEDVIEWLLDKYPLPERIVVKPHPAEGDYAYLKRVMNKYRGKVIFTQHNTFELIERAEEVVVINSSVGLESILMGKKVTFKGRSFYSRLTSEELVSFITHYTANIDFFNPDVKEKIPEEEVKKFFPLSS